MDLYVEHGGIGMVIEIKAWRDKRPDPLIEGLEQIERYLARMKLDEGFLVLFDQRTTAPEWAARMQRLDAQTTSGRKIQVFRG